MTLLHGQFRGSGPPWPVTEIDLGLGVFSMIGPADGRRTKRVPQAR